MDLHSAFLAVILGLVEAATEFLPVSSTGHLLLAGRVLGFENPAGNTFDIVIQLGAILAICVLYFNKLWGMALGSLKNGGQRRYVLAIVLAFLPAAVLGALLHDYIKTVLFNPWVVCVALVLGGIGILLVERFAPKAKIRSGESMGWRTALGIGFLQCLAMIPGVSRSGASIMGALCLGVDRRTATEFSFFLAIPTMLGATVLDVAKTHEALSGSDWALIGVGFAVSFFAALAVVKWFIGYVQHHTFTAFAYYRMAVGMLGLALLYAGF
ncbi:MAG TPA: undecaprenyl-diphosphate phosphatase [Alphaproteobacteria bacterium]|nr:undecaprenyl-diphosphate phosphatase [Alphaproteobacteria bacterium]